MRQNNGGKGARASIASGRSFNKSLKAGVGGFDGGVAPVAATPDNRNRG
jgi:hypothetical protein